MLSIVLYGRNDSYGYNLHKRAAIGLNCMAELLSQEDDEILFVDYNTPDDYPTFPEAIADTLTPRAIARLRILRVRPTVHDRLKAHTHLQAIEPVARNVAVRRSNPRNAWILSTNTDMVFVPHAPGSLSDIAADLAPGYYHLPRFELPESLWEGFDRMDPAGVIERIRPLGRTMFLNEIVYGEDYIKYDGPGDFQLIAREDLFRIDGFDEDMVLGWHVDSNIAKRLYLIHGRVGDAMEWLYGYHCDHTRQVTPAHRHKAVSNDPRRFIDDVARCDLPGQAATWGCSGEEIEEIRLARSSHHVYMDGLYAVLRGEWASPARVRYVPDTVGTTSFDARRVIPFLADLVVSAPRHWNVAWVGGRSDTFRLFREVWARFGFTGSIRIEGWSSPLLLELESAPGVIVTNGRDLDTGANLVIVDFSPPSASAGAGRVPDDAARLDSVVDTYVRQTFAYLVDAERALLARGAEPRRFVCVGAIHNDYEMVVQQDIVAASTPFASRLRHGFVKPHSDLFSASLEGGGAADEPPDLLRLMRIGEAGDESGSSVVAPFGRRGLVVDGPYARLPPGDYRVEFSFGAHGVWSLMALVRPVIVEVAAGAERLAQERVRFFLRATHALTFSVSPDVARRQQIYFRVFRGRWIEFRISSIRLRRTRASASERRRETIESLLTTRNRAGAAI
jgi:hypothetical protein